MNGSADWVCSSSPHRKHWEAFVSPWISCLVCFLLLDIWSSAQGADPSLGPWTYETSLQTARAGHGMVAGPKSLYVIGGHNERDISQSSVEYAVVADDGSLSVWQFASSLNTPRTLTAAVATANHVYVIGGAQHSSLIGSELATVEYAPILPDGSLGTWQFTSALTAGRANAVAMIHGNFVYVVGGDAQYFDSVRSIQAGYQKRYFRLV